MGLLDDVVSGKVTPGTAEQLADRLVQKWHDGELPGTLADAMGMNEREFAAWAPFGAKFETLALWRKEGWPSICGVCGLAVGDAHWALVESEGRDLFVHLQCWQDWRA